MAKKPKIEIKPENEGSFTEYAKEHGGWGKHGKILASFIEKAKRSKNPSIRKQATFAQNARKWN